MRYDTLGYSADLPLWAFCLIKVTGRLQAWAWSKAKNEDWKHQAYP